MHDRIAYQGITFDDILLEPGFSELLPRDVDTRTQLTAKIPLNIPILSAPMDTVTEAELAIALAQEGGLGVIHKNISIEEQTREVDKVKRSENGIIVDPITLPPDETVGHAREIMRGHNISGVPITVEGRLRGILTRRDLRFLESNDLRIEEVMTKENLVTAPADTSLEEADRILTRNKVEKLLLVDDAYRLKGLITIKDIDKLYRYPHACKDSRGRLRVGGGRRGPRLRADRIALGSGRRSRGGRLGPRAQPERHRHGSSDQARLRHRGRGRQRGGPPRGPGPSSTPGPTRSRSASAPGSICTTRVVTGVGVPQITAIDQGGAGLRGADPDHRRRRHPLLGRHRQGLGRGGPPA